VTSLIELSVEEMSASLNKVSNYDKTFICIIRTHTGIIIKSGQFGQLNFGKFLTRNLLAHIITYTVS